MGPMRSSPPCDRHAAERSAPRTAARTTGGLRPLADAIRYAVEDLRTPKAFGAWLEVGDQRFNGTEIQRLYEADEYPLRKPV